MRKPLFVLLFFCFFASNAAFSAEPCELWQWHTALSLTDNTGKTYTVSPYLWISPTCKRVNAVMLSSTAVLEQTTAQSAAVRAVCAKYGIAIVWADTQYFHDEITGIKHTESILEKFATISGYNELETVPWIPVGHSATLKMVRDINKAMPDRLAFMLMHKNNNGYGISPKVPVLTTYGEYGEWDSYGIDLNANMVKDKAYPNVVKARNSGILVSYFFDPNTGHFDCSEALMENIARWMDAICALRFTAKGKLQIVLPEQGWVTELPVPGYAGFPPKRYTEATLTERQNPWFPSYKTALAAYQMANIPMNRKTQLAGFADAQGNYENGWWRGIMYTVPYRLNNDGTLTIHAVPYYRMPQGEYANKSTDDPKSPDYGKLHAFFNKNDTFSNSGNRIEIAVMSGNLKKISTETFEYIPRFDSPNYLIVREAGNETYRTSIQPGKLIFKEMTVGAENIITFPPIAYQKIKKRISIPLYASSNSGLKVKYFVQYGPARIENDSVVIEKNNIPRRAKMPIQIAITAYQLGAETPPVKTSISVTRVFELRR